MDFYQSLIDCEKLVAMYRKEFETIDEISILFDSLENLEEFSKWILNKDDIWVTYSVKDKIYRLDKPHQFFKVQFEFVKIKDIPYRIEAFTVISGTAPLHHQRIMSHGSMAPMHVSYKLPSLDSFFQEGTRLAEKDYLHSATYINDYGLFSYYRVPYSGNHFMWVKPRLNLRDRNQLSG
jgi:hypothetical protein